MYFVDIPDDNFFLILSELERSDCKDDIVSFIFASYFPLASPKIPLRYKKLFCKRMGCKKSVSSHHSRLCTTHRCMWFNVKNKDMCSKERQDGSSFCSEHTCAAIACLSRVSPSGKYCEMHMCRQQDLINPGSKRGKIWSPCLNEAYTHTMCYHHYITRICKSCDYMYDTCKRYCYLHTCRLERCSNVTKWKSYFCDKDDTTFGICEYEDCLQVVKEARFCEEHKCIDCGEISYANGKCVIHYLNCDDCFYIHPRVYLCGKHRALIY